MTTRVGRSRCLALAWLSVLCASPAGADELAPERPSPQGPSSFQEGWEEAQAAERAGLERDRDGREEAIAEFRRAAQLFESIAQQRIEPDQVSEAYWRSARSVWLVADTLPREAKDERVRLYLRSEELAGKGIEVDPKCGACMLWKFSSMGRLATTRGIWGAGRQVPVMADLLDRGIALEPTYADNDENSILGNLHYSSAIFYRVLPDWFFMSWFFGVRGDKERSLRHIETALTLHPHRLEYQVELGSQLLCLGTSRKNELQLARGKQVLRSAVGREATRLDDEREIDAAQIMLETPRKACGYSGDTWLEIDRKRAKAEMKK